VQDGIHVYVQVVNIDILQIDVRFREGFPEPGVESRNTHGDQTRSTAIDFAEWIFI